MVVEDVGGVAAGQQHREVSATFGENGQVRFLLGLSLQQIRHLLYC